MLGCGESEELAGLKGTGTQRAVVARGSRAGEQPFDLTYGSLQEQIVGGTWGENVRVLGVILRENVEECRNASRDAERDMRHTWGMLFGLVSPAGYTLCYKYASGC